MTPIASHEPTEPFPSNNTAVLRKHRNAGNSANSSRKCYHNIPIPAPQRARVRCVILLDISNPSSQRNATKTHPFTKPNPFQIAYL